MSQKDQCCSKLYVEETPSGSLNSTQISEERLEKCPETLKYLTVMDEALREMDFSSEDIDYEDETPKSCSSSSSSFSSCEYKGKKFDFSKEQMLMDQMSEFHL